jgi:ATP synthase proteolipid subunit
MGAAYGTAKSGVGIASMGVMRPELVMKSIVPVVMAGVLGIYGLIIAVIISTNSESATCRALCVVVEESAAAAGAHGQPRRGSGVICSCTVGGGVCCCQRGSLPASFLSLWRRSLTPTTTIFTLHLLLPCLPVSPAKYTLFDGFAHLSSGLSCGLAGLAAGMAIGIVGDAGVR